MGLDFVLSSTGQVLGKLGSADVSLALVTRLVDYFLLGFELFRVRVANVRSIRAALRPLGLFLLRKSLHHLLSEPFFHLLQISHLHVISLADLLVLPRFRPGFEVPSQRKGFDDRTLDGEIEAGNALESAETYRFRESVKRLLDFRDRYPLVLVDLEHLLNEPLNLRISFTA